MRTMRTLGRSLGPVIVAVGLLAVPAATQAPEAPPLPRLEGICRLTDAPGPNWRTMTVAALGVRLAYPPNWSPEEGGGSRLDFVAGGRVVVRLRSVDTGGLTPLAWLQTRLRATDARGCRLVSVGGLLGHQCFDAGTQAWTTFLLTGRRVLAVEVSAAVPRDTHCGILSGIVVQS